MEYLATPCLKMFWRNDALRDSFRNAIALSAYEFKITLFIVHYDNDGRYKFTKTKEYGW